MYDDFSVLIGVYYKDNPVHFSEAMDSILTQTIKSNDIVLAIDGELSGRLKEVVKEYIQSYPEIHAYWLSQNVGQGASFHQILPKAKNEIVFRMDADDIAKIDRFEKQMNYLKLNPHVSLLSSNISEFEDTIDNIVSVRRVPQKNDEIIRFSKRWNPMNHPAVVFKKTDVLSVGGYEDFVRHEDYYLWVRMIMAGFVANNMPESLLYYRISSDNLKRRTSWDTVKHSIKFHYWMQKVGFSSFSDTAYTTIIMLTSYAIPNRLFTYIYKKIRS
jgi:glycosyltransferase involved in cell wall biosynthesis